MVGDRIAASVRRAVSPNLDEAISNPNSLGLTLPFLSRDLLASLKSPMMLQSCFGFIVVP
jgi:hypothetical protein